MVIDYSNQKPVMVMNISKFKATCLSVVERIRVTGEPLLLLKNGEPIAVVNPPPVALKKAAFGLMKNRATVLGDLVEPLGAGDWEALQ